MKQILVYMHVYKFNTYMLGWKDYIHHMHTCIHVNYVHSTSPTACRVSIDNYVQQAENLCNSDSAR